jgi:hypothetical protein
VALTINAVARFTELRRLKLSNTGDSWWTPGTMTGRQTPSLRPLRYLLVLHL